VIVLSFAIAVFTFHLLSFIFKVKLRKLEIQAEISER